jgi:hypothetical protein
VCVCQGAALLPPRPSGLSRAAACLCCLLRQVCDFGISKMKDATAASSTRGAGTPQVSAGRGRVSYSAGTWTEGTQLLVRSVRAWLHSNIIHYS